MEYRNCWLKPQNLDETPKGRFEQRWVSLTLAVCGFQRWVGLWEIVLAATADVDATSHDVCRRPHTQLQGQEPRRDRGATESGEPPGGLAREWLRLPAWSESLAEHFLQQTNDTRLHQQHHQHIQTTRTNHTSHTTTTTTTTRTTRTPDTPPTHHTHHTHHTTPQITQQSEAHCEKKRQ